MLYEDNHRGYVTHDYVPNSLVGNLMEVIEAVGLEKKQEEAVKNLVREKVWNLFNDPEHAILISEKRFLEFREAYNRWVIKLGGKVPKDAF